MEVRESSQVQGSPEVILNDLPPEFNARSCNWNISPCCKHALSQGPSH